MTALTTVRASGDGYQIGRAIAAATPHVRDDVAGWVADALAAYPPDSRVSGVLENVRATLQQHSPSTLAQVEGMASGYALPADGLLLCTLETFFRSAGHTGADSGCSTFAARGGKHPTVLAKNRDSDCRFLGMQTVVRVTPKHGREWAALSTAGAAGVHSAGMNATGLAIADTHVPSDDVGIGLPRFSLMMETLEQCSNTREAIAYLSSVPRMGFGNLILADPDGDIAVIECGHSQLSVIESAENHVVATNHFVSAPLARTCLQPPNSEDGRDTRRRHRRLNDALTGAAGQTVDPVALLSSHEHPGATCVHGDRDCAQRTIASIVLWPQHRRFGVSTGNPCSAPLQTFTLTTTHPANGQPRHT